MTNEDRGGPQSADPQFRTVWEPGNYANSTDGPVRYTPVYVNDEPVAYLWAATDDSAAGVVPRGPRGFNAAAGWNERLVKAYADGLSATDLLTRWAGTELDPADERSGVVHEGEEREAASLDELKRAAQ
ncbi:hypothetical protein [Tenggerimyces flavus]|uniref:Uncharacterized protein n=1 Tax=Tenggerimyces flavus TaxID=1708749 RepID=A0ABV7YLB1_9ACTN|nr:hypothetical protein [Tenggerimyces flavus]MBM7789543.1 hypothetical protein [Tenggerimyces flavus]